MSCSLQVCFILQTVVQPVRMEEHAIIHLPTVTVTVPVGTRDPTASTGVCIAAHTTGNIDPLHLHYCDSHCSADCSSECKNGGVCVLRLHYFLCDCPSGYLGVLCEYKGMYIQAYMQIQKHVCKYIAVFTVRR